MQDGMSLNRKDVIAGYPAKTIRDLLRHDCIRIDVEYVAHRLKIQGKGATVLLNQLKADGYLDVLYRPI
jgi:Mn-dependent DtxR family transcriptional regulator